MRMHHNTFMVAGAYVRQAEACFPCEMVSGAGALAIGLDNVKRNSFLYKVDWLEADDVDCQVFFGSKPDSDWSHVFEYRSFSHIPSWWLSTQEEAS